eukprot:m.17996 g.17996  ORF g.17996 m.17996 type:complete len:116 (-) comp7261_c0_seq1:28-375(-)
MQRSRTNGRASDRVDSRLAAERTEDMLENENNNMLLRLQGQVQALKSITIDINNEAKDQNRLLSDMDSDFTSTGGLLGGSMHRLRGLAASGQGRVMCYLVGFILFVFFLIYYLMP